jgi:hypothetical protein
MALILLGLAPIPFREMRRPGTFPLDAPNTHFSGLNFKQATPIFMNVSIRLEMYALFFLLANTTSMTYVNMFLSDL